jgi:dTDP-6-deoxy-L-talose 4-dehydrogenase (NAD+)
MRILVTGATGFVGKHLMKELIKTGNEITITTSRKEKINLFDSSPNVSVAVTDLNEIDVSRNYFNVLNKPDLVLHLAWQGLPNYHQLFHFEKNLNQHYIFLKNLVENGLKDLVVTGTCFEYGKRAGCLSEDMIANPLNAYALAKDTLRKFLEQLQTKHPFQLKWVRLFYMYGDGQNPNSLLSQLEKATADGDKVFNMSGGEQKRDYLPVEKVAYYIKMIAMQNEVTGIINCCSGRAIKIIDLIEDFLQKKSLSIQLNKGFYPYPDDEAMSFWGDDTRLKKILENERPGTGI